MLTKIPPKIMSQPYQANMPPLLYLGEKHQREYDSIAERCKPLRVGSWLIMLMVIAVAYMTYDQNLSRLSLIVVAISAALTMIVLISLCENNNQMAAWVIVLLAPLVVSAFAIQIESILLAFFGPSAI